MSFGVDAASWPVAVLTLDASGRIIGATNVCGHLLGYSVDELTTLRLGDVLPLAARAFFQTHVFPELALHGHVNEVYVPLRSRTGEALPVLLNGARRPEASGSFVDVLAFLPMSRRHFVERELVAVQREADRLALAESDAAGRIRAMQAQLAVSEHLASVGMLAAGVAHEINNPLTYASGNAELLHETLSEPIPAAREELLGFVSEISEGLGRIRDIVGSLKKLSRVDDTVREPVDLRKVIDSALKISGAETRHRAKVEVSVSSPPPVVLGDEGRLCQVLINLAVNAAQAMPTTDPERNVIRVEAHADGTDHVVLTVKDNGPGVPVALRGRIFEPFFSTKPPGKGTGLGLSVCHGIITSLGGSLTLESPDEGGALFRVTLPCGNVVQAPTTAAAVRNEERAAPAEKRRYRVLVVDDDEPIRRLIGRALRDYDVDGYSSGPAALAKLSSDDDLPYDIIMCDLMMPAMSGVDVSKAIIARFPAAATRFLFMTGGTVSDEARALIRSVEAQLIRKPFAIPDLLSACEAVRSRGSHLPHSSAVSSRGGTRAS